MTEMIQSMLKEMAQNAIHVTPISEGVDTPGATRLGGCPDVPPDFQWPWFRGKDAFGDDYAVPLTFLGQFNCHDMQLLNQDQLLPNHGVLSFFYEADRQPWGFLPTDQGSGRVYWFPESGLQPMEPPVELPAELHLSSVGAVLEPISTCPDWEDLNLPWTYYDAYEQVTAEQPVPEDSIQLLGWPQAIQGSMPAAVELVTRGYDTGGSEKIPPEVREQAKTVGLERWQLLLQLSPPKEWTDLMFGDCGVIYFWITKEDLAARNFDRVWVVLQCG